MWRADSGSPPAKRARIDPDAAEARLRSMFPQLAAAELRRVLAACEG